MNRIKELRTKKGISVRYLADKVDINFVSLNRMERGEHSINEKQVESLANYFNVSADYLLGRDFYIPEKTVIKTADFGLQDIYNKLHTFNNNELSRLAGAIEMTLENRANAREERKEDFSIEKLK